MCSADTTGRSAYPGVLSNSLINGRAPGGEAQALPFECPIDHIFTLDTWFRGSFKDRFREAMFMSNPNVPDTVKNDVARVQVLPGGKEEPVDAAAEGYATAIREGLTDGELRDALRGVEHHRVLEFSSITKALCGFENEVEAKAFDDTMESMLKYRMYYCPTEPWRAAGSPRLSPWQPDIVKRHCGFTEAELLRDDQVHLGEFVDSATCFCEFGFKTPTPLGQCQRS